MSLRLRILYIAGFLLAFMPKADASSLSLNETALKILLQSPGFMAGHYSLDSEISNLKTSANLPDPELSGEYLVLPSDVDNRWAAQLEWSVEWPGVYHARGNEARSKMTTAQKNLYSRRLDKLAEIKSLLIDYVQCCLKLDLLNDLSRNNDTIYSLALQAAKGGEMTVLDLNKVKLEYANIKGAIATIMDEEAGIIASLSQIAGKDCSSLLKEMDCNFPEIIIPDSETVSRLKHSAPEVVTALAEAESAREAQKVARMEALPSLSLGYKHAFEDGMHFNGAVFGISIPMFSSRGKQKAAKANILDAEYKAEATSLEIEAQAAASVKQLTLAKQQIEEIAPLVENTDYNEMLLKAYKGGVITIIDYITERNYFTNAAIELVTLRHMAAKAQAEIQKYLDTIEF